MLKIFHAPRTRSVRVVWLAEEMGIPYEIAAVDFGDRSPEFRGINPTGTLPAIEDDGVVLTESVAILQYLAERYGPTPLAVKPSEPGYGDYLQFLVLGEAGLAAPLNAMIGCRFFGKPEDLEAFAVKVIAQGFQNRLKLVSRQLDRGPYMVGDRFTAADISVAWTMGVAQFLEIPLPDPILDYHRRCTERPAYQRTAAV